MKEKLKKLFFCWAYLDFTGACKKENTYFYQFPHQIGQGNFRMMRSMSIFMLIISVFVIASTYTYFGDMNLRHIYVVIAVLEIVILVLIHRLLKQDISSKVCTILTSMHLFHMLVLGAFIGVFFCQDETALLFIVVLTIASMIFTLPPMISLCISIICTIAMLVASYYVKESYWFESDVLNGVSVLLFSIMLGWRVNRIRAEEAFARADAKRLNEELRKISVTDSLTGIYNYRGFQNNYYEMFSRAIAQRLPMGVILMDLDEFKSFNDLYGHVAGDNCLRRVAETIAEAVPKGVTVSRYGGEEFIVLLSEDLCYEAESIGEKIRKEVAALKITNVFTLLEVKQVTLSLGSYVGVPSCNEKPMNFVERADKAMYESKKAGRNRLTATFENKESAVK